MIIDTFESKGEGCTIQTRFAMSGDDDAVLTISRRTIDLYMCVNPNDHDVRRSIVKRIQRANFWTFLGMQDVVNGEDDDDLVIKPASTDLPHDAFRFISVRELRRIDINISMEQANMQEIDIALRMHIQRYWCSGRHQFLFNTIYRDTCVDSIRLIPSINRSLNAILQRQYGEPAEVEKNLYLCALNLRSTPKVTLPSWDEARPGNLHQEQDEDQDDIMPTSDGLLDYSTSIIETSDGLLDMSASTDDECDFLFYN